jgi:hypothetical protein
MATVRVRTQEKETMKDPQRIIWFGKEDGWFVFREVEIEKDVLEKFGTVVDKTEPDIFPIFKEILIRKARSIFGI